MEIQVHHEGVGAIDHWKNAPDPLVGIMSQARAIQSNFDQTMKDIVNADALVREFQIFYDSSMASFDNLFLINLHAPNYRDIVTTAKRRSICNFTYPPSLMTSSSQTKGKRSTIR
jgi:hypothetical protein